VQNPVILLCDEATSALDSRTEKQILQALQTLAHGRTSLFVAHRLSTAAQCDQIVVLEGVRRCVCFSALLACETNVQCILLSRALWRHIHAFVVVLLKTVSKTVSKHVGLHGAKWALNAVDMSKAIASICRVASWRVERIAHC
jgi:ABC-type multidrug transport system ATPase subunit